MVHFNEDVNISRYRAPNSVINNEKNVEGSGRGLYEVLPK
jgi:hypothetical protein